MTEPVSGQVAPYSQPQQSPPPAQKPRSRTALVPGPSLTALAGAAIIFLLGFLLGVANQGASGTSMNLRVPALLAALLMVGQAVVDFRRGLVAKPTVEHIKEDDPQALLTPDLPVARAARARQNVTAVAPVRPTLSTLSVPIVVLSLAAWLGLADLMVDAPDSLAVLSLISSFALFALGWSLLPNRH